MRIDELRKIAEENYYVYFGVKKVRYDFIRDTDGALISISKFNLNDIYFLDLDECQDTDLRMIKASIEFAETHPDEREGKLDTDLADFELVEVEDE